MIKKVSIIAPCHPCLIDELSILGYDISYTPYMSKEELQEVMPELHGLVVSTRIAIDRELVEKARRLQWIARLGSGLDHIDLETAHKKNIKILSSPEGNAPSVAEYALGLLLSTIRHIGSSHEEVKNYIWNRERNRGSLLSSHKIGIIGYGHMGEAFTRILYRMGCSSIMVHDTNKMAHEKHSFIVSDVDALLAECSVISLHINLTKENYHYADEHFFSKIKQRPIFINTSRGACVKTASLLNALDTERIGYACIDVLENEHIDRLKEEEKAIFNRLVHHPRAIVTPHIAGVTEESFYHLSKILAAKIKDLSD